MDIEAGARRHGVRDEEMLHAVRYFWRHMVTDDSAVTMFIGPSTTGQPLEVAVVRDDRGTAIIHAMGARRKYLGDQWLK